MEYKTKRKEVSDTRGQKKQTKLAKVNKKQGSDSRRPEEDARNEADDFSNDFPSFSVLTKEEKLAFFEALSAARKSIEKRGLPTRERFGTVHDEYLEYFTQDDKGEALHNKPDSVPSSTPNRSPVVSCRSPKETKPRTQEPPKEKLQRIPKPLSPKFKPVSKPPRKSPPRPESEPIDKCDEIIKRDTDKVIQMYLEKKKRIEEQWKKASQAKDTPPTRPASQKSPKMKDKEPSRPTTAGPLGATTDPKPKRTPPSKGAVDTPQFRALNPTERKEFFRILREAHNNVVESNPQKKNRILPLEEVLRPYKAGAKVTTAVCTVAKDGGKGQRDQRGNLRVKVTLTSGDNERLNRTKSSQVVCDKEKAGSGGRSKSLESMQSADTAHGKQSKIPILRKAPPEKNEDDEEPRTLKKAETRFDVAASTPEEPTTTKKTAAAKEKPPAIDEDAEEVKRKEILEKLRVLEGDAEETQMKKKAAAKEKKLTIEEETDMKKTAAAKEKKLTMEGETDMKKAAAAKEKPLAIDEDAEEAKKKEVLEKIRTLEGDAEECTEDAAIMKKILEKLADAEKKEAKNKGRTTAKTKRLERPSKESDDNPRGSSHRNFSLLKMRALKLEKKKAEFKKTQSEKDKMTTESAKKEKEQSKKKRRDDWRKRLQRKDLQGRLEKKPKHDKPACDSSDFVVAGKRIPSKELTELHCECPKRPQQQTELHLRDNKHSHEMHQGTRCRQLERAEETCPQQTGQPEQSDSSDHSAPSLDRHTSCQQQCPCEPELECGQAKACPSQSSQHQLEGELVMKAAQSRNSLAGVSLVEERPGEVWEAQQWVPTFTTGKVIVVDDNVIRRIKALIYNLDTKVNPKESLESEYLRLVLGYTEYLTKTAESIVRRKTKEGQQQVHSTYTAHEVHLKFDENEIGAPREDPKRNLIPRSISATEFQKQIPGPSGIEKQPKGKLRRNHSSVEYFMMSDSDSSLNSEDNHQTLGAASYRKPGIPETKIRLLQDLLKGRAKFEEGSISDFKIVRCSEAEQILPEKIPLEEEETKELSEVETEPAEKAVLVKFLRNLAKLCNCGRKQIEEDAILENLKGEAVRVDTFEEKKGPASATINQSTMEVLKAAERKKIIEKYLSKDKS